MHKDNCIYQSEYLGNLLLEYKVFKRQLQKKSFFFFFLLRNGRKGTIECLRRPNYQKRRQVNYNAKYEANNQDNKN